MVRRVIASMLLRSPTSAASASALRPSALTASAVDLAAPSSRSTAIRCAPARPSASADALDVVEPVAEPLRPVLPGRAGRVRREGDVLQRVERVIGLRRLLDQHVEPGRQDLSARQRLMERRLVHDGPAAGVDEDGGLLHHPELARADKITRALV